MAEDGLRDEMKRNLYGATSKSSLRESNFALARYRAGHVHFATSFYLFAVTFVAIVRLLDVYARFEREHLNLAISLKSHGKVSLRVSQANRKKRSVSREMVRKKIREDILRDMPEKALLTHLSSEITPRDLFIKLNSL